MKKEKLGAFPDDVHIIGGLRKKHYGFKEHIVISSTGIVTAAICAAANRNERDVCPKLTEKIQGLLLGDKGFIRPELKELLAAQGLALETPLRDNTEDARPRKFLKWMLGTRHLIETVLG